MYRPPSSNNAYLKSMLDQIDNVFSYNENIILTGDINYDYKLDESLSSNPLHQIEILYGMRQLINSPIRVTPTTSTLIDVMFSTEHESHIVTEVYNISLCDHYMTYTIYSKIAHTKCLHKEIMFRNYKRFNIDSFRNALSKTTVYLILAGLRINSLTSGMTLKMSLYILATVVHPWRRDV